MSKPVYNLKIDAIKRLFCTISLFLSAWAVLYLYTRYRFFSPFAVLDVSALQEREWMHIAVFVMAIITGIFVLPVFLDNQLQRGTLLKSVIGYALCTYLCAISSLYSKSLYQIIVDNYDEKYGSSYIGDLVNRAGINTSVLAFGRMDYRSSMDNFIIPFDSKLMRHGKRRLLEGLSKI